MNFHLKEQKFFSTQKIKKPEIQAARSVAGRMSRSGGKIIQGA